MGLNHNVSSLFPMVNFAICLFQIWLMTLQFLKVYQKLYFRHQITILSFIGKIFPKTQAKYNKNLLRNSFVISKIITEKFQLCVEIFTPAQNGYHSCICGETGCSLGSLGNYQYGSDWPACLEGVYYRYLFIFMLTYDWQAQRCLKPHYISYDKLGSPTR